MKKLIAGIAAALTLALAGTAGAYSDVDGGGSSTPQVYIVASITYRSDGFPIFLYCRYLDFGNGLVIQDSCWS